MKKKENMKTLKVYIIFAIIIFIVSIALNIYREESLLKSMKTSLQEYFKNNNSHISSHNFNIDKMEIVCYGNDAYLIEFNLTFEDDNVNKFNKLGVTMFKNDDDWNVKGFGKGLTVDELKKYNFKCRS